MLILNALRFQITKVRDRWGYSKEKQPYRFGVNEGRVLAFAGIWEQWKDLAGNGGEKPTSTTECQ